MSWQTHSALRQGFLAYFGAQGHTQVDSGPLVPAGDPSLMFTNAGMVPFKDVFVGAERRPYVRATSCQKCMRVSGKHNDLEEVGRSARHHTFFEMLGNFSFGDYFKEEAIAMAWRFVTQELGLPTGRLWVTVFGGAPGMPADDEAARLWAKIGGLPPERILPLGVADNFWSMGESGPCGPCTEIYIDQGEGPVSQADFDSGRVVEIWNNVFMQFNRQGGKLTPLPNPCVDTGMGLERVAAFLQGHKSNFHSDLFAAVLDDIAARAGRPYGRSDGADDVSMRVIADHARAVAFAVEGGVQPSNEGRGYVLRRIMRRAIRHGRRLDLDEGFMAAAAAQVVATMGPAYPELTACLPLIQRVAQGEETAFRRTLESGLVLLNEAIADLSATAHSAPDGGAGAGGDAAPGVLPGSLAFRLYDTYGFPPDLTALIAAEHQLVVDDAAFAEHMQSQRVRSRRGASPGGHDGDGRAGSMAPPGDDAAGAPAPGSPSALALWQPLQASAGDILFVGGPHEEAHADVDRHPSWQRRPDGAWACRVQVRALVQGGASRQAVAGGVADVVLSPTPFYAESGGQVGDTGELRLVSTQADPSARTAGDASSKASAPPLMRVDDTQLMLPGLPACRVSLSDGAHLEVGQEVWATYSLASRRQLRAHHSATHLLHAALRQVLGDHVRQAGSRVDSHSLRFDFSHFQPLSSAEAQTVEDLVNAAIQRDAPVEERQMAYREALAHGAMALFGEKYGERVRVITMGDSVELCGGTHAHRTGELQQFLLLRETSVQSGVRRVVAESGARARQRVARVDGLLRLVASVVGGVQFAAAADRAPQSMAMVPPPGCDAAELQVVAALERADASRREAQAVLGGADSEVATGASQAGGAPAWELPQALAADLREAAAPGAPPPAPQAARLWSLWRQVSALLQDGPAAAAAVLALPAGEVAPLLHGLALWLEHGRVCQQALAVQAGDALAEFAKICWLSTGASVVDDVSFLAFLVPSQFAQELRPLVDRLRDLRPVHAILLACQVSADKLAFVVAVAPALEGRLHAGRLLAELAPIVGGRGGGKQSFAQGGGPGVEATTDLLAGFRHACRKALDPSIRAPRV